MGVAQAEVAEDEKQGNCHRDRRHHALREHEEQEVLLGAEAKPRQAVCRERGKEQGKDGGTDSDDQAVADRGQGIVGEPPPAVPPTP